MPKLVGTVGDGAGRDGLFEPFSYWDDFKH